MSQDGDCSKIYQSKTLSKAGWIPDKRGWDHAKNAVPLKGHFRDCLTRPNTLSKRKIKPYRSVCHVCSMQRVLHTYSERKTTSE